MSGAGTDLAPLNRWLCITRLRAACAVFLFALALNWLNVVEIDLLRIQEVCAALFGVSILGLVVKPLERVPRLFFYLQCLIDLGAITLTIGLSADGLPALLFRSIYVLVIVPASLISVPSGLLMAAVAAAGHEWLLGLERGFSPETLASLESVTPPFLFFLIAQQCFFYGKHLERKNAALAALATRLEESRKRLVTEAGMSTALLDVARTLSSTWEPSELFARLNSTMRQQLGADWSATFLVDGENATFKPVAMSESEGAGDLTRLELPTRTWTPIERLAREPVVILTGPDAERTPGLFLGGRRLSTAILAGLYRDRVLVGFLAVGYSMLETAERERAVDFMTGIAQHATLVLRNAHLLEEVRLASAMKSEFVGAISHELRSPLNVVLGYLEMTIDGVFGPVTSGQVEALSRVRQQSLALLEMITALLDLNRLEAGRLPVQAAPVSVRDLLEEIRQQLPEGWRRPEVELKLAIVPRLPEIETDAGKLRTVVRNLLHNAFKFTEHGQVTLGAGLTPTGDLQITVSDTGRGIAPDAIKYIFELFRQVPGAGGGGVGLGLHLVRRLVQALGGTVSVVSEVGKGTCFTVTLPRTATPSAPADRTIAKRDPRAHAAPHAA